MARIFDALTERIAWFDVDAASGGIFDEDIELLAGSPVEGVADVTLDDFAVVATATVDVFGVASLQLDDVTVAATATVAVAAAASIQLDDVSIVATAVVPVLALLDVTLDDFSVVATASDVAPAVASTTTTPALRALLIANIAAIDAHESPGFRVYRHDQGAQFTDWCDANPAGAFRRYSVRDYGFDAIESVNQTGLEWRRVQLRITVAYPHTNRAGAQGAVSRDALMRIDRHAIEVATGLRAYISLETLPAVYLSSRASKAIGASCDFLVIDAVYGFFATPV